MARCKLESYLVSLHSGSNKDRVLIIDVKQVAGLNLIHEFS